MHVRNLRSNGIAFTCFQSITKLTGKHNWKTNLVYKLYGASLVMTKTIVKLTKVILTVFPYSHEVLIPSSSSHNAVFLKPRLLQQPRNNNSQKFGIVIYYII